MYVASPESHRKSHFEALFRTGQALRQQTLKTAISCTGIALHSGAKVTMTIHPAEADSGIVFRRVDLAGGGALIPAHFANVVDTRLCTRIADNNGVSVATIEHLMAALAGSGVDNALIEINGPEVPVMDGSAQPFVFLIDCAGTRELDRPRRAIKVLKRVQVEDNGARASLTPSSEFSLGFEIEFASRVVSRQRCRMLFSEAAFRNEICRARTFGFEHEVAQMRAAGLAKGGSLDNAVVVSGDRVLNEDGLRYEDEFVRHKVLDAIGDLALAGAPLVGHFQGARSGHALNNRLLRALFADADAWCWTEIHRHEQEDAETLLAALA